MALLTAPYSAAKEAAQFNPYDDNGGTIVAVAGDSFVLIASDTRLSTGFSIYSRNQSKLFRLPNNIVLGSSGCWCDTLTLTRLMNARMKIYLHEHNKQMSTPAVAQMLSTMLYYKRFFPYYVSNILVGLGPDGSGLIYNYDPIGSLEKVKFRAGGSSGHLLQPLLDNQLGFSNLPKDGDQVITQEKALQVVKDVFVSATERDIYTGDSIIIYIISKSGIEEKSMELRKD